LCTCALRILGELHTATQRVDAHGVVGGCWAWMGSQRTAARLQATAVQYQKVVEDLEQVLTVAGQSPSAVNAHALPGILANQHQYLLHVAAKVEAMHVRVADAKHAALHVRRAAGDQRDPFQEAAVRHQAALRAAQVPSLRACLTLSNRFIVLRSLPAA
jgi:hypothetical protein